MIKLLRTAAFLLCTAVSAPVMAQDFDKGAAAYQAGDYAAALQEFMPLAEQGDADAQYNLGLMYKNGEGVPQDYTEAVKLYRRAVEQGNAFAQTNLGAMYAFGEGVAQDYTEAVTLYRLAAEQGDADAQYNLGQMYRKGEGVAQDYTEAVKLYRLAAEQANVGAQGNLGVMYAFGEGVAQDYVTAHMWGYISAVNYNELSVKLLHEFLVPKMTPAAIEEAQSRAIVCMASNYQDCY